MSEPKKVKINLIPIDATVTLEISGQFHKRLLAVYFNYVKKIDTEVFEKLMKHLNDNELDKLKGDELNDAISLQTLLIIIGSLEKKFTDAKLDTEKIFELPTED
jgi:hypothetical protein